MVTELKRRPQLLTVKYACPSCGQNAWVKPGAVLVCGSCMEPMGGKVLMKATCHEVEFRYTHHEIEILFFTARFRDVKKGGRYHTRPGTIEVWRHNSVDDAAQHDAESIGTFYFHKGNKNHLWMIVCNEGSSLDDLLQELWILEEKALPGTKHGRRLPVQQRCIAHKADGTICGSLAVVSMVFDAVEYGMVCAEHSRR